MMLKTGDVTVGGNKLSESGMFLKVVKLYATINLILGLLYGRPVLGLLLYIMETQNSRLPRAAWPIPAHVSTFTSCYLSPSSHPWVLIFLWFLLLSWRPLLLLFLLLAFLSQHVLWQTLLILPLFEEAGCAPALLLHNTEPPGQGVITTVSPLHSPNAQWESDKYFIHSWSKCLLTFTIQCARYYDKCLKHFSYPTDKILCSQEA